MYVLITASDSTTVFSGSIEEMPSNGFYADVYEEAVNQGKLAGSTDNGWFWEIAKNPAAVALGRKGGSTKSANKAKTSAANGRQSRMPMPDLTEDAAAALRILIAKQRRRLGAGCIILSHGAGSYSIQTPDGAVHRLR